MIDFRCLRCVTPAKCAVHGCSPGAWSAESDAKAATQRQAERERCAIVCEAEATIWEEDGKGPAIEARLCAARIRAMKDKP